MAQVIVTARKWGNSIGVTFPAEAVEMEKIHPKDKVAIEIKKVAPIKELFGTLKTAKPTQKIKDEMRAGWG